VLYRILTLATDRLKQSETFCEKTVAALFDAIMNAALQCVGLSKNKLAIALTRSRKLNYNMLMQAKTKPDIKTFAQHCCHSY
jgi:hypothetical protein